MAARKNDVTQQQKNGGRRLTSAHKLRPPLSCNLLLTITLLTLFKHIDIIDAKISCINSPTNIYGIRTTKDSIDVQEEKTKGNDWCYMLYNLDGVDRPLWSDWNLEPYTYVAGWGVGGNLNNHSFKHDFFGIHVCHNRIQDGCETENTTYFHWRYSGPPPWRLDFVCCCYKMLPYDTDCNYQYTQNTPLEEFTKRLNDTKQQICVVDNFTPLSEYDAKQQIDNCTRRTGQTESPETPSRCRSTAKWGALAPEMGCAHDGTVDRCEWAKEEPSGVCRQYRGMLECCCTGAFCNCSLQLLDHLDPSPINIAKSHETRPTATM